MYLPEFTTLLPRMYRQERAQIKFGPISRNTNALPTRATDKMPTKLY